MQNFIVLAHILLELITNLLLWCNIELGANDPRHNSSQESNYRETNFSSIQDKNLAVVLDSASCCKVVVHAINNLT